MKIAIVAAGIVASTSLLAQPTTEFRAPLPSVEQIETLCPGVGNNPLQFGEADVMHSRRDMPDEMKARLAAIEKLGKSAGFEEARLQPTDWSQLLMAVDYATVVPKDVALDDWRDHMTATLVSAGWEHRPDEELSIFAMNGGRFEKDFATPQGTRRLAIEIDTFGMIRGFTMRCGEKSLLALDSEEKQGRLAPGSVRPVEPGEGGDRDFATWLAAINCDDPRLRDRLGATDDMGQIGPIVMELYGDVPDVSAQSTYQQRLNTWLQWKLVADAVMSEDDVWDIVAAATPEQNEVQFEAFLDQYVALASIEEELGPGSAGKVCLALKDFFEGDRVIANDKASRLSRVNAALIAEGTRRGLRLD